MRCGAEDLVQTSRSWVERWSSMGRTIPSLASRPLRCWCPPGCSCILSFTSLLESTSGSRSNEFATRIALGAGRGRILSQTLTETILLAIGGGGIGAVLATYGARLLAAYGPDDVRLLTDTRLNVPFFLFSITISLTTGII